MAVDMAAYVRRSREAQGLPPTIEDPSVLARVASVLSGGRRDSHQQEEAA